MSYQIRLKARAVVIPIVCVLLAVLVGAWALMNVSGGVDEGSLTLLERDPDSAGIKSSSSSASRTAVTGEVLAKAPDVAGRVRLSTGTSIRARLVQAGQPLASLEVEVWWTPLYRTARLLDRHTTSATGVLHVGGLEDGYYKLVPKGEVVPKKWVRTHLRVKVGENLDLGDWRIPRPSTLEGIVVDEQHRPLAGIRIFHAFEGSPYLPSFDRSSLLGEERVSDSTLTDSRGRFRFDLVSPGSHALLAESLVYADHQLEFEVEEGSAKKFETWILERGREVRGRVVDRSGRGIAKAAVSPMSFFDGAYRRKAVRTDESGLFHLRGLGELPSGVQVEAKGYAIGEADIDWNKANSVDVTLDKALFLVGRVEGTEGRKTVVLLGCSGDQPSHVYGLMWTDQPVASDGSFRIAGLVPGQYRVEATTQGLGRSKQIEFEFKSGMKPLVLKIRKDHILAVEVVDERGRPIEGARLHRDPLTGKYPDEYETQGPHLAKNILDSWRAQKLVPPKTDAQGKAELFYPAYDALAVAASAPLFLPVARFLPCGQVPKSLRLVLPAAARIHGRVEGLESGHRPGALIRLKPVPESDKSRRERQSQIDAKGSFQFNQLAPGRYSIGISYVSVMWNTGPGGVGEGATPILGAGLDLRSLREIDVLASVGDEILLVLPKLGSISGVVRDADGPVEGATVFAVAAGTKAKQIVPEGVSSLHSPLAYIGSPNMTTGKDGIYRFAYMTPGAWDLRARAPSAVVATPPVRVETRKQGERIQRDLLLGSSSILGRLHAPELSAEEMKQLSVFLIGVEEANEDPFYWGLAGRSPVDSRRSSSMGKAGRQESDRWNSNTKISSGGSSGPRYRSVRPLTLRCLPAFLLSSAAPRTSRTSLLVPAPPG